ncbi:MAG TPA: peptide transporter [Planctomycetota bacterium]|nr:peptide transporter [Planctomycetota bacterium]
MADDRLSQEKYEIVPEGTPFQWGFSWNIVVAALFVGFVMMPGAIYLGLITGQTYGGAADWVTIILFIEIAKRSFVKLRAQEIIIMYWIASGLAVMGPLNGLIYNQYLVQCPMSDGIHQDFPSWVVPARDSAALIERTFVHRAWAVPLLLALVLYLMYTLQRLSLGYVLFRLTSDMERLPFPLAPVHAGAATALAETSSKREGWRWRVFSIGSIVGVLFGLVYIGVPVLSSMFFTRTVQIIPIPWLDLTPYTGSILPATPVAISMDLAAVIVGFVLPFWLVVGAFLSAMAMTFIGTPLLYKYGILYNWNEGMSYVPTQISNSFDFWISFSIGASLVILFVGIGATVRALVRQRRERLERAAAGEPPPSLPEGRGDLPMWKPLAIFAATQVLFVGLCRILVPEFPWWIPVIFGFVLSPMQSYINARMVGITGGSGSISFPFLREASFYGAQLLTGRALGVPIWFAPMPIQDLGQAAGMFKQLELTKTHFGSVVYSSMLAFIVLWVCSFIYWSWIWKLDVIPSSTYPFVQKMWPLNATINCMWMRTTLPGGEGLANLQKILHLQYIVVGFGIGSAMYAFFSLFGLPTIIFYGFLTGIGQNAFMAFPQFLGAMLGRYYFRKRLGDLKWRAYAPILMAGYGCGVGLIGITTVALKLISSAVKQTIF